jgi:RecG-like helicase
MNLLLKLSIIFSLNGILVLLIISNLEPKITTINQITNEKIDLSIKIKAIIQRISISKQKEYTFLELADKTGNISASLFSNKANLTKNKEYYFYGKISEYNKTLTLNIDRIASSSSSQV